MDLKKWRLTIITLALASCLFFASIFGWLTWPKNIFWNIVKPVGVVLNVSFGKVPKFFKSVFHISTIVKQNHNLIEENLELQSELAKLQETKYENEILKKELNFANSTNSDLNLFPAAIIGKTSGYLKSVTIDKGEKDGLFKGQAVVSQGFLVGTVSSVRPDNAEVILITDYNSLIPVVLQESRGTGLIRGGLGGLIVEDIPLNIAIKQNENVITSGLGGLVPNGVAVGVVREVVSKPGEIFQKVTVISPVDISKLEVLFVVKK